jgi:lysophospholipid acyltransferase (LPLAT)-like uncharacterized protein
MAWLNELMRKRWMQRTLGITAAEYVRFVGLTNRRIVEPADTYERVRANLPVVFAMWHGQHFFVTLWGRPEHRAKALISRHRDGEIAAIAVEHQGFETVRGSGDHAGDFHRKGAVGAFRRMLDDIGSGHSIVLTADVPKVARRAGLGIVTLAQKSGRPIFPLAVANSRRLEFEKSWDKSAIGLPFGRMAGVIAEPIWVPEDADDAALEAARQAVEDSLNAVTARAYALVDGKTKGG